MPAEQHRQVWGVRQANDCCQMGHADISVSTPVSLEECIIMVMASVQVIDLDLSVVDSWNPYSHKKLRRWVACAHALQARQSCPELVQDQASLNSSACLSTGLIPCR